MRPQGYHRGGVAQSTQLPSVAQPNHFYAPPSETLHGRVDRWVRGAVKSTTGGKQMTRTAATPWVLLVAGVCILVLTYFGALSDSTETPHPMARQALQR